MSTIILPSTIQNTLSDLAKELKISEVEIIKRAIEDFARKIQKKNTLIRLAGTFNEQEANSFLMNIYENRTNKTSNDILL